LPSYLELLCRLVCAGRSDLIGLIETGIVAAGSQRVLCNWVGWPYSA
jgi:hypothetical protein